MLKVSFDMLKAPLKNPLQKLVAKLSLLREILNSGDTAWLRLPGYPLGYESVSSAHRLISNPRSYYSYSAPFKSLDLGCGMSPKNPFQAAESFGIDLLPSVSDNILSADLSVSDLPFESSSFYFVTAFDFIEHIPRCIYLDGVARYPFISLLGEVYRVLKPGGLFYCWTPAYPAKEAFQDPTHVNIITEDTLPLYFTSCEDRQYPFARMYGFRGNFRLVEQKWYRYFLVSLLVKIQGFS